MMPDGAQIGNWDVCRGICFLFFGSNILVH